MVSFSTSVLIVSGGVSVVFRGSIILISTGFSGSGAAVAASVPPLVPALLGEAASLFLLLLPEHAVNMLNVSSADRSRVKDFLFMPI
ncbi:hypothetical protein D3C87_1803770 [compost metagenome]